MINGHRVSCLIITCDKAGRLDTIFDVLKAWVEQPVDEIIFMDCSDGKLTHRGNEMSKLHEKVTVVRFSRDWGIRIRHAMALITTGDYVIQADDDVMPSPGFAEDLVNGYDMVGAGIVGVIGRQYRAPSYYKGGNPYFRADQVEHPTPVDFIGVCYCSQRDMLIMDVREQESAVSDIYWAEYFADAPKHIVPTKNYKDLPSANAPGCLFKDKSARSFRELYYEKIFNERYKDK